MKYIRLVVAVLFQCCAFAQVVIPGCGNEGQKACLASDKEYGANNDLGFGMPCDFGLVLRPSVPGSGQPATCVNGSASYNSSLLGQLTFPPRSTQPPNTSWTGWALHQQRYGIGGDAPMNYVTTTGTHNSFSNSAEGFFSRVATDQRLSITDQLNLGARYIRLDGYFWLGEMRVCHGDATECSALDKVGLPISSGRLFANAVQEVANWLNRNPSEFIVLDLNGDPAGYSALVMEPIKQMIGTQKIVNQTDAHCGPNLPLPVVGPIFPCTYPSLNWAASNGKQLIILANHYGEYDPLYQRLLFARSVVLDEKDPLGSAPDFTTCQDANYKQVSLHATNQWPYTSEDRSSSVIALARGSFLGYLDEPQVHQAAVCGYSLIAFDFLNSRSRTFPDPFASVDGWPTPVTVDTDHRFEDSIWSFEGDNYGTKGYAFMQVDGRWGTTDATAQLRYACTTASGFDPNADWFVSQASGPYFDANGNLAGIAACKAQGGYFGHPYNGAQNALLFAKTFHQNVWLNYVVNASQVTFDTLPAGLSIMLDNVSYQTPVTLPLVRGSVHKLVVNGSISPSAGTVYTFQGWSDGVVYSNRQFVVPAAPTANLTAKYATKYAVTLAANPKNGGTVSSANQISGGFYPAGATLTLTATPAAGYTFGSFSGAASSAANPITFVVNGPVVETANFNAIPAAPVGHIR